MDAPDLKHYCAYSEAEGLTSLEDPGPECNALVREHAVNPRNFGDMSEGLADGYACIVDPECGDRVELWIIVEKERIFDLRFKSNGCASTRAANSMMTVLALGKTVHEAKQLQDENILSSFHGALDHKRGCPLSGVEALHTAIEAYEAKSKEVKREK